MVALWDRFEYVGELGEGATARVIRVLDLAHGAKPRALKVVASEEGGRLLWEMARLREVHDVHVAEVHDLLRVDEPVHAPFGLSRGSWVLVESFAPGSRVDVLARGVRERRDEWLSTIVRIGLGVAEGLAAIHAALLVHGDVKPANVLATHGAERVTLLDLGMAREPGVSSEISGTPSYLPPEAWAGVCTFSRDVYALGALLFDLLAASDHEPALGSSGMFTRRADALESSVPRALIDVVMRALSPTPEARPESATAFAGLLISAARKASIPVPARASRYVTGRVTLSPSERASRALNGPWMGHATVRAELSRALLAPQVIAVTGPGGSGRTRLIREALLDAQRERVARDLPPLTLVASLDAASLPNHAVVHLPCAQKEQIEQALRFVSAARRTGRSLTVVVEVTSEEQAQGAHTRIDVGPLSRAEVVMLLSAHLEREPNAELVDAALRISHGFAGRLSALIARVLESGRDPEDARTWDALHVATADQEGLSSAARRLLHRLSIAGRSVNVQEGLALLGEDPSRSHVRELFAKGLVSWTEGGLLVPDAIARVVRAELGEEARDDARSVEAALSPGAKSPWAPAFLCDPATSLSRFEASARELRKANEPTRLASFLEEARRYHDSDVLRFLHADALRALGAYGVAAGVLEGQRDVEACLLRAELLRLTGNPRAAIRELEPDASWNHAAAPRALAIRARAFLDLGELIESETLAQQVIDRRAAPLDAVVLALEVRTLAALFQGRSAHAEAASLLARARSLRSPQRLSRALSVTAQARAREGQTALASEAWHEALSLARDVGAQHEAAAITVNLGVLALDTGELAIALERLREGVSLLTQLGKTSEVARALLNLANAAWAVGDVDAARAAIEDAAQLAEQARDVSARAFCAVVDAELLMHHGEVDAARSTLEDALSLTSCPPQVRLVVFARASIANLEREGRQKARAYLAEAETLLDASDVGARAEIAVARTRLLLADLRTREAESFIADALSDLSQSASFEAHVRLLFAGLESARVSSRDDLHEERLLLLRAILERAMAGLSPEHRARMRNLPAYARVLAQASKGAASSEPVQTHAWRRLVTGSRRLFAARTEAALAREVSHLALELVHAERAFVIVRREDGTLAVLSEASFAEPSAKQSSFSRSVLERAWSDMVPLVTVDARVDERLHGAQSVHALSVRSVAAVPFRAFSGPTALYLDDRVRASAFGSEDTALLVDLGELASAAFRALSHVREERREARKKARTVSLLERELTLLRAQGGASELVGNSTALLQAIALAKRAASSDVPVLIRGESGSGKELFAKLIHASSDRHDKPFVVESCAALPETLLESALFGHVRGAFTGADRARAGLFELAHGGTLFLDEVGEMSPGLQAKLLRVLTDGVIRPLGGEESRRVDVRVVTATHRDLSELMKQGAFREDLFYRIAVVDLLVPSLAERLEDIPLLVSFFVEKHGAGRKVSITAEALDLLQARPWPGNVRQLEALLRRALVLATDVIDVEHLVEPGYGDVVRGLDLHAHTDALQKRLVRAALEQAQGNQTRAAELLGLSRFGLQKMLKRLQIS